MSNWFRSVRNVVVLIALTTASMVTRAAILLIAPKGNKLLIPYMFFSIIFDFIIGASIYEFVKKEYPNDDEQIDF